MASVNDTSANTLAGNESHDGGNDFINMKNITPINRNKFAFTLINIYFYYALFQIIFHRRMDTEKTDFDFRLWKGGYSEDYNYQNCLL
jgi:hypothetical protein